MSKPASFAKDWSDVVKGAKRELLLRAARDEFAEQGLEGATMRGIALRAGCTTGAIYPLFDSKEAIYAELLKQSLAALDAYVAEAVAAVERDRCQAVLVAQHLAQQVGGPGPVVAGGPEATVVHVVGPGPQEPHWAAHGPRHQRFLGDLLQARGVPVLLDEIVEVVEDFPLTLRQWQHGRTIRKGKAKVNGPSV